MRALREVFELLEYKARQRLRSEDEIIPQNFTPQSEGPRSQPNDAAERCRFLGVV